MPAQSIELLALRSVGQSAIVLLDIHRLFCIGMLEFEASMFRCLWGLTLPLREGTQVGAIHAVFLPILNHSRWTESWKAAFMKTTIDLPEDLVLEMKFRAVRARGAQTPRRGGGGVSTRIGGSGSAVQAGRSASGQTAARSKPTWCQVFRTER
jgi:hypothetical protein